MKRRRRIEIFLLAVCLFLSAGFFAVHAHAEEEEYKDGYGELAYQYVQEIDAHYPYRINNNDMTTDTGSLRAMGQWINGQMNSFGYETVIYEQDISDHHFVDYCYTKPGVSEKKIVIGAHYDCVDTRGCEDNGTGVAMVLELAKRFKNKVTPLTLEFCFFDGEEYRGFAGSYIYLGNCRNLSEIVLYVNIDCVGAGDTMYAYGGMYNEEGRLDRDWGLQMALALSDELSIPLHVLPETVTRFRSPTRDGSSDHYYFNLNGVPYVYFEANQWVYEDGTVYNEERPYLLNTLDSAFADTNGQIIHTKYDDFGSLDYMLPGVMRRHLHDFSKLISTLLERAGVMSSDFYSEQLAPYQLIDKYSPLSETAEEEETETETEESEETEEEPSKETESETPPGVTPDTQEQDTPETQPGPTVLPVQDTTEPDGGKELIKKPEEPLDYVLLSVLGLSALMVPVSVIMAVRASARSKKG
ncbi:MAG: M28 family peptidase [Lachnospiraceae bacterium]|nr:M28 family peptidase [Lachnospiraceae bacterium]